MKQRLPFAIVIAALVVSAPRLAVAFLLADGVGINERVQVAVYVLTGVASGIVLTGGNVYLAHALAEHWKRRGGLWVILLVSWALFLGFAVVLIAPALVYGLTHSVLAEVLASAQTRWAWAIVAALSVEVLAAAAMAAHVLNDEPTQAVRKVGVGSALSAAIVRRLERTSAEAPRTIGELQPELRLRAALVSEPLAQPAAALAAATLPLDAGAAESILSEAQRSRRMSAAEGNLSAASTASAVGRSHTCAHCARPFATQQALAAHSRSHKQVTA